MDRKRLAMIVTLALLGLSLALLWLLAGQVTAAPAEELTVCPAGPPDCDYAAIQDAVDAALDGDVIKVATGAYSGVQGRPAPPEYLNPPPGGIITQVVYLSKTVDIRGGYTAPDFAEPPDPIANPTTLDAEGQGRALFISGDTNPTIEGLRFTGGNASGLGGYSGVNWDDHDAGGGVCIVSAMAVLSNNLVFGNTAGSFGSGGGLYLLDSDAVLRANTVTTNTANTLYGGGLYTLYSEGSLVDNTFSGNSAGWGGAVFLEFSPATLFHNLFTGNSCISAGGALNVHTSNAEIAGNTVTANEAMYGGGMRLYDSAATLRDNLISGNSATGYGGGLHLWISPAELVSNTISANTTGGSAGAIEFWLSDAILANNVIADNEAADVGTAMYILASYPQLLHNTIARNSGTGASDGSGIFVDNYESMLSGVWLTDTILVSHTVGIHVVASNEATLEATLWGNESDWAGEGTILTGTVNIWGDPAFVAPDAGDYHLKPASAAIDTGLDAGLTADIDGEQRPVGSGYDIGADEFPAALIIDKQAHADIVRAGEQLTYTIHLSNTGLVSLTATITDFLPSHVTPTGILTWTPPPIAAGQDWSRTVVVFVELSYTGPLTNVVQVTTEEGATGAYTNTVVVPVFFVYLPLVCHNR
jgi:uncharacterized repeat protein (TIGR01451 family)